MGQKGRTRPSLMEYRTLERELVSTREDLRLQILECKYLNKEMEALKSKNDSLNRLNALLEMEISRVHGAYPREEKTKKTMVKEMQTYQDNVPYMVKMQQKIDKYEIFINGLAWMINCKKDLFIFESEIPSWETGEIYKYVRQKIKEDGEKQNTMASG